MKYLEPRMAKQMEESLTKWLRRRVMAMSAGIDVAELHPGEGWPVRPDIVVKVPKEIVNAIK